MKSIPVVLACFWLGVAGCAEKLVDPCSGVGSTCVALYIDASPSIDTIDIHIGDEVDSRVFPHGAATKYPVTVALKIGDARFVGIDSFNFSIIGNLSGAAVATGNGTAQIVRGRHTDVHVTLVAQTFATDGAEVGDVATNADTALLDLDDSDLNATDLAIPAPDLVVPADLAPPSLTINVTKDVGTLAKGNVVLSIPAATCDTGSCAFNYPAGGMVTLTPMPDAKTSFAWSGDCAGSDPCTLDMSTSHSVTAIFTSYQIALSVVGGGTVNLSLPTSAQCPPSCIEQYPGGTMVTLTPAPTAGNSFAGWSGPCLASGFGPCTLTLDATEISVATFGKSTTLQVVSSGSGDVVTKDGLINCGANCNHDYGQYSQVVLDTNPQPGYGASWSGACGSAIGLSCTVTMDTAKTVTVAFVPDVNLSAESIVCTPTSSLAGAAISCTITIRNRGTLPAGAFTVDLRLSSDATIGASDPLIGTCSVAMVAAGDVATTTCSGSTSAATVAGAYRIGAIVDSTNTVMETSEIDNTVSASLVITAAGLPDLIIASYNCSPQPALLGGTLSCEVAVANAGGSDAGPSALSVSSSVADPPPGYFSSNAQQSCGVPALSSGQLMLINCLLPIPANFNRGAGSLDIYADVNAEISESNESNNEIYLQDSDPNHPIFLEPGGPDLTLYNWTCPVSAAPGTAFTCTGTVVNSGVQLSPNTTIDMYLSSDTMLDSADVKIGSCAVAALGSNAQAPITCAATMPAGTGIALWNVVAFVDPNNTILEGDETNNDDLTTVIVGPDLSAPYGHFTCPTAIDPGATVSCTLMVSNYGSAAVGAFNVQVNLTTDYSSSGGTTVGSCSSSGITAGNSATLTCPVTIPAGTPVGAGGFGLYAIVDSGHVITEANEANNSSYRIDIVVGHYNLTGVSVSCTPNPVSRGAMVNCTATYKNNGTLPMSNLIHTFYLSADAVITSADSELNFAFVSGSVMPGDNISGSGTFTIPTNAVTGSRYIGAIGDWVVNSDRYTETNETDNYVSMPIVIQ